MYLLLFARLATKEAGGASANSPPLGLGGEYDESAFKNRAALPTSAFSRELLVPSEGCARFWSIGAAL